MAKLFPMRREEISGSQTEGTEDRIKEMGRRKGEDKKERREKQPLFCWTSFNRFYFKYQTGI